MADDTFRRLLNRFMWIAGAAFVLSAVLLVLTWL